MHKSTVGERLRQFRLRLGLTTREVSEASRKIAGEEGSADFMISHARLVQIESGDSTPSVHKLFTLSAVYGVKLSDLLSLYLDTDNTAKHHISGGFQNTHLLDFDASEAPVAFPKQFNSSFDVSKTNLLSRMVEVWGEVPASLLRQLSLRKTMWGVIGLGDYTMYPMLRPGSLVQIEPSIKRPPLESRSRSEYERPLYFVELRDSYICCWCELKKGRLFCVPHPLSPVGIRDFSHPHEAELVGQVTAVACRLVNGVARLPQEQAAAATGA
jgi:transcriptional regulator with XRE-family HTH domain